MNPPPFRPAAGAILSILHRRLSSFLIGFALVLGLALSALAALEPRFTASALILVDPGQKNLLSAEAGTPVAGPRADARVESEVGILRSDRVALATVRAADLLDDPEFAPRPGPWTRLLALAGLSAATPPEGAQVLEQTLAKLRRATTVRREGLTYLVRVSVTAAERNRAAHLANTMARTYIRLQLEAKVDSFLAARDLLEGQIEAARDRLARSEDALDRFVDANPDLLGLSAGAPRIRQLRQSLKELSAPRRRADALAAMAGTAVVNRDWDRLAAALEDEALEGLLSRRHELDRVAAAPGRQSDAVGLRERIAGLELEIAERARRVTEGLRDESGRLNDEAARLREEIRQELGATISADALSRAYALRQDAEIAQRHYATLLSRLRELEAQSVLQVADSRIVSDALTPGEASFPRVGILLMIALVAASGVGVAVAVGQEYLSRPIVTADQLRRMLPGGARVVALPRVAAPRGGTREGREPDNKPSPADLVLDAPLSAYGEALRRLRAEARRASDGATTDTASGCRVIMVGSCLPDEGKTTVAVSLARSCAASGQRTLLIDADLRRPGVHRLLGLPPSGGLRQLLDGDDGKGASAAQSPGVPGAALHGDPRSSLSVLTGRAPGERPDERALHDGRLAHLIERARHSCEVIVIDTPPLHPVVDGLHVLSLVDGLVLCVRHGRTPSEVLAATLRSIGDVSPGTAIVTALTHSPPSQVPAGEGYYTDARGAVMS